ncbi:tubulin polyglutamylase complex subunit 2 [Lycorma delicatula]|uniref:tubulin polyglutamylase complex subunit 2 n=1 Tax=Lycorma delicatula TaxID=130591 RepID=UPI003F511CF4
MLISSWEQRHSCSLPDDMRQFYAATDGFKLIWNYEYAGEILPIGNLKINSIMELRRIAGVKPSNDAESPSLLDVELCNKENTPSFGVKCKIFEIDPCQNIGKVCLVYTEPTSDEQRPGESRIWLLDRSYEWHFLADSFSQYFRMMLVHQGLPQWQFHFTPIGLTPWAEQMMMMVAPHLFASESYWLNQNWKQLPNNTIDPAVFKTSNRAKNSKHKTDK